MNDKFLNMSLPWAKDNFVPGAGRSIKENEPSQDPYRISNIPSNTSGGQDEEPGSSCNTVKDDPGKDIVFNCSNLCFKEVVHP